MDKENPDDLIYKEESYIIIGICMEVHKILGKGFSESVYKDALEYEFRKRNIPFEREKLFEVGYKDTFLKHRFCADFIVYGKIVLEAKSAESIVPGNIKQTLNYRAVTKFRLGIVANFGEDSFKHKRVVL